MSTDKILILIAMFSSFVLLSQRRPFAVIALVASGVEGLMAFGIVSLDVAAVPLPLVLAGTIAAVGVIGYLRTADKLALAAAAVLAVVGGIQLLRIFGIA